MSCGGARPSPILAVVVFYDAETTRGLDGFMARLAVILVSRQSDGFIDITGMAKRGACSDKFSHFLSVLAFHEDEEDHGDFGRP